jgi:hypothetical protein
VPIAELKAAMEDWFRRKSYLAKGASLVIEESAQNPPPVTPSPA